MSNPVQEFIDMVRANPDAADAASRKWLAELQAEEDAIEHTTETLSALLLEAYPTKGDTLRVSEVLANLIALYDIDDKDDAGQLYLEWTVEKYVGAKVMANLDAIRFIVKTLKEYGYTEDNQYEYNDLDNHLFYIPDDEREIFCATSQNTRYIYILKGDKLHIRRYWDQYPFDSGDDWRQKEEVAYNEKGIVHAIKMVSWLNDSYSDCLLNNQYPRRPDLQYFKNRNFDFRYNDCRDIGYVLSTERGRQRSADRALYYYSEIKRAFLDLRCALGEMKYIENN